MNATALLLLYMCGLLPCALGQGYGVSFAELAPAPYAGRYNHGAVSYRAPDQRLKIAVMGGYTGQYPGDLYDTWIMDVGSRWYFVVYPPEVLELDLAGGGPKAWRVAGYNYKNDRAGSDVKGIAPCNGLLIFIRGDPSPVLFNPADGKHEYTLWPGGSGWVQKYSGQYAVPGNAFPLSMPAWAGFGSTCTLLVSGGSDWTTSAPSSRTYRFIGTLAPLTASWTQPAPGGSLSVPRGASVNVSHSALSRAFGPAVLYLVSSGAQMAPVQYRLLSGVILSSAGGNLSVQLPAAVNGGQYFFRFSMVDVDGGALDTPTFAVESWRLLDLAPQVDGLELFANGSVAVAWTSAAWPFHADVYLLPSIGNHVLVRAIRRIVFVTFERE
eukprot:tig00001001_g6219.t1